MPGPMPAKISPQAAHMASSTIWPMASQAYGALSTAARHSGCMGEPKYFCARLQCAASSRLIQSLQVAALHIAAGRTREPSSGPALRSRQLSRTERLITWLADRPIAPSRESGPAGTRPTGLEAKQPAMRGRNADGATAIAGMPHGQDTCSHYRSRATGGSLRSYGWRPGVAVTP